MDAHKYDCFFSNEHQKEELKGKSIRGGLNTMMGEGVVFVLRIGSTIFLARLLMPEHFGLISMVSAITAIAERFKDLGLSSATVQRKDITHEQVSTLFWINVGLGALITLTVAALSYLIGWFYGDKRLVAITLAYSASFFFGGLTIQHQALLRRQMRFGYLACIQVVSMALSVIISIFLALYGFNYWALVWKEVSRTVFIAGGTWIFCNWLPSLPVRGSGINSMIRFGRDLTAFNIVYYFTRSLDQILIGKFWGAGALGFYRQANQLISQPLYQLRFPVEFVAEPLLSTLQNEPDSYRKCYKKIISLLSFCTMPIVIYLAVFSENLVRLLLGEKWIESINIFRVLAIAGFIQPVTSTCGFVMVTLGRTRRYFIWGLISSFSVITAFCVGVLWGPLGVSTAYAICSYVTFVPLLWFSFRDTPVSISLVFEAVYVPAFTSLLMGIALLLLSTKISALNSLIEIPLSITFAIVFYFVAWLLFPGGKHKLVEYFTYSLVAFRSKSSTVHDVPEGKDHKQ